MNNLTTIQHSFDHLTVTIPIEKILPTKKVNASILKTTKFQTILSSIQELGIIEPLAIYPEKDKNQNNQHYFLLDGHLRLEALKMTGCKEAICLISTDDENFTYNRQINRLTCIQEYRMILATVNKGISTEKIAKVLNVNLESIKRKLDMLNGITPEVIIMLKDRMVAQGIFSVLKKMKSERQIEVVKLMIAANRVSKPYAEMMLIGSKSEMLVNKKSVNKRKNFSPEEIAKMQLEIEKMQKDYTQVENNIGDVMLTLIVAKGYISKLLKNNTVQQYLIQYHEGVYEGLSTVMDAMITNPTSPVKD